MSALSRVYQEAVKETQAAREAVAVVDKNEALHQEVLRAVEVTNHDAIKGLQQVRAASAAACFGVSADDEGLLCASGARHSGEA